MQFPQTERYRTEPFGLYKEGFEVRHKTPPTVRRTELRDGQYVTEDLPATSVFPGFPSWVFHASPDGPGYWYVDISAGWRGIVSSRWLGSKLRNLGFSADDVRRLFRNLTTRKG